LSIVDCGLWIVDCQSARRIPRSAMSIDALYVSGPFR
jgi:hypothetical protein